MLAAKLKRFWSAFLSKRLRYEAAHTRRDCFRSRGLASSYEARTGFLFEARHTLGHWLARANGTQARRYSGGKEASVIAEILSVVAAVIAVVMTIIALTKDL